MMPFWSSQDARVAWGFACAVLIGGGAWWVKSGEAFIPAPAPIVFPADKAKGPVAIPVIQVNTATAEEWERLPGVGPLLARRIVRDRDQHGLFHSIQEVDRVRGIGPKLLVKISPYLRISEKSE